MAIKTHKEKGICIGCCTVQDCSNSNQGWICHDCFADYGLRKDRIRTKHLTGALIIWPNPEVEGFVFMEGENYLTLGGTLYFFEVEEYAIDYLADLKPRASEDLSQVRVEKVNAQRPFRYCYDHKINLIVCGDPKEHQGYKVRLP